MTTVNISILDTQLQFIDTVIKRYNFANRSEFFRTLIRLVSHNTDMIKQTTTFPLVSPQTKSVKKIMKGFAETGKYSPEFLKDLKEGLESSTYFTV